MAKKINISGEIGWDFTASMIAEQMKEAKGEDIDIDIASPGGDVFDGIQIYNAIRDYKRDNPKSQIMITLKGMGASMASYIMMAPADMVLAEDNAVFMIHNPWSFAMGDYRAMAEQSEFLSGLASLMADAYVKKTGKTKAEITALMDNETWLFGDEIKAAGFVDDMMPSGECGTGDKDDKKKKALSGARLSFNSMKETAQKRADAEANSKKAAALMKSIIPAPSGNENIQPEGKGENEVMNEIKTLEDLKTNASAVYSEAVSAISADAVALERARVKALNELKTKAVKVGAAVALIDEAIESGKASADIATSVMDLVLAAADSIGSVNANGSVIDQPESEYVAIEMVK